MSWIDIAFLVTVALLVFNGLRNGAVVSLVSLLSIPIALLVAWLFGPQLTKVLAANSLPAVPLISYIVLFFGTVLVLHIISSIMKNVVGNIPLIGTGDKLLGGVLGFVEAWVLWLVLLLVLGSFLGNVQGTVHSVTQLAPGLNISVDQFKSWQVFYNDTVTHSLFATVNNFFTHNLHGVPTLAAPSKP